MKVHLYQKCGFFAVCFFLFFISESFGEYITREEIVEHLRPKISLSQVMLSSYDDQEQIEKQIVDSLQLERWAEEVLPEKFEVRNDDHKWYILGSFSEIISYNDTEYIELSIKQTLMDVGLRCYVSNNLMPVLEEDDKREIKNTINYINNHAKNTISRYLGKEIPKEVIDEVVDSNVLERLIDKMNRPWDTRLKKKIDATEVDRLLQVYDNRLIATKDRAIALFDDIYQQIEQGEKSAEEKEAALKDARNMLLQEITSPLMSAIYKSSNIEIEELELFQPENILPQYSKINDRLDELDSQLYRSFSEGRTIQATAENALASVIMDPISNFIESPSAEIYGNVVVEDQSVNNNLFEDSDSDKVEDKVESDKQISPKDAESRYLIYGVIFGVSFVMIGLICIRKVRK